MLILSRNDVASLLDLDALVDAVGQAMLDLSAGRASMPPRGAAAVPDRHAMLAAMPAFLPSSGALTTKLVSLFPENRDRPTHQAIICCFDPNNGTPLAVMDGTYVTAVRTAAGSALATKLLARRDARVVAVIGTGTQAHAHATALARLPNVEAIRIAGRDPIHVNRLVEDLCLAGVPAVACSSVEEATRMADVVCAATHADQPVVRRQWLRPGTHVNSVGYNSSGEGEVDTELIRDALLVVESREAALASPPSGAIELRHAIEQGTIGPDHIHAEIGEIVGGTASGRTDESQITLYKSVGVAVQDAAAAALILKEAERRGAGVQITI